MEKDYFKTFINNLKNVVGDARKVVKKQDNKVYFSKVDNSPFTFDD